ncbi:hypothetical protein JR065_05875 [Xanthomonas sp. AmX2]|uniref:hypothetical protein n=1 Tax=Xanthomonas sp. TaxID=29446 RepID=UPI00197E2E74|nr:hypothetical protein [Xanthomonas sp.]MBN6149860.1 hypothetical protein [Xanthomonas sp.]
MINQLLAFLFLASAPAVAATTASTDSQICDSAGRDQAYPPIRAYGATVCFLYIEKVAGRKSPLSVDPPGIAIYSISQDGKLTLAYELPYAGTSGKIDDAFLLSVHGDPNKRLFVIQSTDTPSTWEIISRAYDVTVMKFSNGTISQDKSASHFFDGGGDFADTKGGLTYQFPYKDRKSIERAVISPLFQLAHSSTQVEGKIKERTLLYHGPYLHEVSKMYLIKDDHVKVEDSTAGWCKVSYLSKKRTITMWVQCKNILF